MIINTIQFFGQLQVSRLPWWGYTLYNGLYRESPPEKGTFFRLQVNERVGISLVEVQCI